MIKFTSNKGNKKLIGLGLEAGNVEKLMNGQPIFVRGSDVGEVSDILIFYGATKEQMIEGIREAGAVLPPEEQWRTTPTKKHI